MLKNCGRCRLTYTISSICNKRELSSQIKIKSKPSPDHSHLDSDRYTPLQNQHNKNALSATSIGAAANFGLAASKGTLGFTIGSTALIADCFNSMGDLFSDAIVYYTITEARKIATPENPWGSGKAEPIGNLFLLSYILFRTLMNVAL